MRLATVLAAAAVTACAAAPSAVATPPPPSAGAVLKAPDGADIGQARLQQVPAGLLIEIEVGGLTPGWHGVHIHETGDCSAPDFTSAGGHVANGATEHGYMTASGGEPGDLPNLWVGADGTGRAQMFSDRVSLTAGTGRAALWDADGSAIVIHAARDDHYTHPIGGSGDRVACGRVTQ